MKWEYHQSEIDPVERQNLEFTRLPELGREGWELVAVTSLYPEPGCGHHPRLLYTFKRPIPLQGD
jgi:hypothetical protein